MKICLVQYNPYHPKAGMMDAYNEVVESYQWGFTALGHETEWRINHFNQASLNIVFGTAIPMQLGLINSFPANTIFINLERYSHRALAGTSVEYIAGKYQIWDYCQANLASWNGIATRHPVYYAPISYAPNLEKIRHDVEQDIDVLYYGKMNDERFWVLHDIADCSKDMVGLSVVTLSNVWSRQRDEFIARAKIVVNPSAGNIFEIVRTSYLLANRKAVVSSYRDAVEIETDLKDVLRYVPASEMASACAALVHDPVARAAYAEQCYDAFKRRDVRDVILNFFG